MHEHNQMRICLIKSCKLPELNLPLLLLSIILFLLLHIHLFKQNRMLIRCRKHLCVLYSQAFKIHILIWVSNASSMFLMQFSFVHFIRFCKIVSKNYFPEYRLRPSLSDRLMKIFRQNLDQNSRFEHSNLDKVVPECKQLPCQLVNLYKNLSSYWRRILKINSADKAVIKLIILCNLRLNRDSYGFSEFRFNRSSHCWLSIGLLNCVWSQSGCFC